MAAKPKILVVEDDDDVRELLQSTLEKTYEVVAASNGKIALDLFANDEFALVLTDVYMPSKDGLDLIKEIMSKSQVPIIVESGGNIENFKKYFDYYKVTSVVYKPFSQAQLRDVIQKALQG